jgi:isopropylmalate/homocitrate/citramalate synthase
MADTAEVLAAIQRRPGVGYPVLVPNTKGLEQAIASGVEEIAIFGAASEAFSAKNINCSIAESLERFRAVAETARAQGIRVRGYVSCVLGCPYQGQVPISEVVRVSRALLDLGCYEISLGDTTGVGTAGAARALVEKLSEVVPIEKLAVHFHDTYGQALTNIHACLEAGIAVVDASVAGLGGCPYAKGASGNVATEDVVYLLNGLGIDSGVDLKSLASTGIWISQTLSRPNGSKTGNALAAA